nr:O-antigen ligase family protein [uncultured Rhodopila sp.]
MLPNRLTTHPDIAPLTAAALLLAAALGCGLIVPPLFWAALAAAAAGITSLVFLHPTTFCVAWLMITGMSLEMSFADLAGDEMFQPMIAVVKGAGIGLAVICALRFGPRLDPFNPVWAYLAMLAIGLVHGLHPGLTPAETVRSFVGSAAPFAFCFCLLPRKWPHAMIRAVAWCPAVAIAASIPFAIAGIRPLFVESGGARLGGLGHPAFLAGVCLAAIYACLILLYRHGRRRDLMLLTVNFVFLLLTGARAPLAYAVAVTGLGLTTIRSTVFPLHRRLLLIVAGAVAAPVMLLFAGDLSDIRLFNVVTNYAGDLSGRGLLWPAFEAASAQSPWFGWGIGAGNAVVPPDGPVARTLHTWAAHNEYLRMEVEGGQIGRAAFIGLFAAWVIVHTRVLRPADARIMRLVFAAFACHAVTDNVLISTPACVLFALATAVFADARLALPDSAPKV